MADRCEFCGTRMDGLHTHADSCPEMNETIREESNSLRDEIDDLREALDEACTRIDKLVRLLLEHGAHPEVAIIEADLATARNVFLRQLLPDCD